jgi:hypothetical protein
VDCFLKSRMTNCPLSGFDFLRSDGTARLLVAALLVAREDMR